MGIEHIFSCLNAEVWLYSDEHFAIHLQELYLDIWMAVQQNLGKGCLDDGSVTLSRMLQNSIID